MKRLINRIAVVMLASTLFLTGCSSIPLSTMMQLSSMGEEGIFEANPSDLRVKFAMPEGFTLDVENTTLLLRVTGEDEITHSIEMLLDLMHTEQEQRSAGLFRGNIDLTTYTLKLNDQSAKELIELQQTVRRGAGGNFAFSFRAPFAEKPPDATEASFWVDLQLTPDEPYLRLFDGIKVTFEEA